MQNRDGCVIVYVALLVLRTITSAAASDRLPLRSPGDKVEVRIAELMVNNNETTSYQSLAPLCRRLPFCSTTSIKRDRDPETALKFRDKPVKLVRLVETAYNIEMGNTEECKVLRATNKPDESPSFVWTTDEGKTIAALIREQFQIIMTVDDVQCDYGYQGVHDKRKNGFPLGFWKQAGENTSYDPTGLPKTGHYLYNHLNFKLEYQTVYKEYFTANRKVTNCRVYPTTGTIKSYAFDGYGKCSFFPYLSRDPLRQDLLQIHEDNITEIVFSYSVDWKEKPPNFKPAKTLLHQPANALLGKKTNNTGVLNPKKGQPSQKPDEPLPWKSIIAAIAVFVIVVSVICFSIVCIRRRHIAEHARSQSGTELVLKNAGVPPESSASQEETFGHACEYEYTNKEILGTGAYGTVYMARMKKDSGISTQKYGAVKVTHCTAEESTVLTEAENWRLQHLVRLRHEHLVAYHKITITRRPTGTTTELLMDYCNGGDLADLLKNLRQNGKLLPQNLAVRYTTEITHGLAFLHQNNILHGDLKPKNVLVHGCGTSEERLVIGDLDDLIQMWRSTTTTQDVKRLRGTYYYMSPEMLEKFIVLADTEPVGRKTDIWSLGCIMIDLANHVNGSYEKWLVRLQDRIQIVDNMKPFHFATLVLEGYSHFVPDNPARFDAVTRQCLLVPKEDRLSAEELLQQLKILAI